MLPESQEKHSKIQSLTGIITSVIESCPTSGTQANEVFKGNVVLGNVESKLA